MQEQVERARILVIDDEPNIQKILSEALKATYDCQTASSAEEGLELLRREPFSLVISDINMDGITGLEMAPQILTVAPDTVVIMMSGAQNIESAVMALRVGAFDYLVKPFDLRLVEAAVRRGVEYHQLRISKKQYETQLETKVEERTAALLDATRKLETEIAERNRAEERLNYMKYHDVLTELPNRALFKDRVAQSFSSSRRENQLVAVLLLSIDRFKEIGETLGSTHADELICAIADRLTTSMREGDTLAYWGSDEFALLFNELERTEDTIQICKRLQSTLGAGFILAKDEVYVTASIGIALHPLNGHDEATLMNRAATALAQAKQKGGNTYQFYTAAMNSKALYRLSLESSLRRAIEREEFVVYYQPKVDINTWRISGAEALVRWNHPEKGLIAPAEFIPLAEETGLIAPIDEWVLRNSCATLKQWSHSSEPLTLSTNISARQFQDPGFFSLVMSTLEEIRLAPGQLELELTESSIMTNLESGVRTLCALQGSGVRISVDDFGTGFSSLAYLKRLPLDVLKIDRSFVHEASTDPDDAALVMAIITLAHNLRLKVVAEGVESEDQLRFLHLLRCDEIQGYLFSKPLPAADFQRLLCEGQYASGQWNSLRQKLHIKTEQRRLSSAA
ncbi:MAG TPA: EAL domain-containing protein [Pyrinomonadaceae bacterium]|nr:EAL domain-containing protein [Pyrinomonadaceae bacterium]